MWPLVLLRICASVLVLILLIGTMETVRLVFVFNSAHFTEIERKEENTKDTDKQFRMSFLLTGSIEYRACTRIQEPPNQ